MTTLAVPLPPAFAPTRESLRTLACYVVSPARKARTGRIGLQSTGDGFGTPPFDDGTRVVVRGATLAVEPRAAVPITTVAAAAAYVGLELSPDPGVGKDLPPFVPEAPLDVDEASSLALGAWYAVADAVLQRLGNGDLDVGERWVWPEHFDLATVVTVAGAAKANVGFSPGDATSAEPYVYVGPWDMEGVSGPYWNASFGALLPYATIAAAPEPAERAAAFIAEGLDLLRARTR
jgi:hypothetical protein